MTSLATFFKDFFSKKLNIFIVTAATAAAGASFWLIFKKSSGGNPQVHWNKKYGAKKSELLYGKVPRKWLAEQETRLRTLARQHAPRLLNVLDVGVGEGQNGTSIHFVFLKIYF